jgi:hypothetical protein
MDVTVDNLLNQVAQTFFEKFKSQNIDSNFLQKFLDELLKKIQVTDTQSTFQKPIKEGPKPSNSVPGSKTLSSELKLAYKQLLTDNSYVNEYKRFLSKVLNKESFKNLLTPEKTKSNNIATTKALTNISNIFSTIKDLKNTNLDRLKNVKNINFPKFNKLEDTIQNLANKVSKIKDLKNTNLDRLKNVKNINFPKFNKLEDTIQNLANKVSKIKQINPVSNFANFGDASKPKLIKEEEKPKKVILYDIANNASKTLKDKFANIFENFIDKLKGFFEKDPKKGGFGLLGGALALLLGGLAALVTGLMTDGPFKGLLKILSKVGIQGALKVLEIAAKFFMSNLKAAVMAPVSLLRSVAKTIGQIFGKEAFKTIIKPLRGLTGIFTKMLGGLVKMLTPLLKRIPLIGSIISWGFAYTRFKSGDVVGGVIDVLSGIATLFPGVGTVIGIGLDVLNAFLDFKSGGATKETSQKKTGIIGGWMLGLGKLVYKSIKSLPVIGPLLKSVEEFSSGNYLKGIKQLAYIITPLEFIGALLGDTEASGLTKTTASVFRGVGSVLANLTKWVGTTIYKSVKSLPILGPLLKSVEEFSSGNYLKGIKQLAYVITPLEFIGALLGDTEASGLTKTSASVFRGIGSVIGNLLKWVSTGVYRVFKNLPIIGPVIKSIEEFTKGNYLKGLKQLAYIITPLESIGALLGDTEISGVTKMSAGIFKGVGNVLKNLSEWVAKTIWRVFSNLPILGPVLRGVKELFSGNFVNGLKQLIYVNPMFELLGSLLGDTEIGRVTSTTSGVIKNTGGVLKNLGKWVAEKITNIPVIGPLLKMIKNFTNSEWKEGFKNLGRAIGLGGLISFFESKPEQTSDIKETTSINPFTALKNAVLDRARKWWKKTWSWVKWLARRVLPSSVIKALDKDISIEDDNIKVEGQQSSPLITSETLNRIKDATKKILSNIGKNITNTLQKGINTLTSLPDKLKNITGGVFDGIKNIASSIWDSVKNTIKGIKNKISNFTSGVSTLAKNVVTKSIDITRNVYNNLKGVTSSIFNKIKNVASNIWGSTKELLSATKDKIQNWWENSSVKKIVDTGLDTAKNWYEDLVKNSKSITDVLKNARDSIFDKVSGFFKNISSNISSGVKSWWSNLSADPRTWVGTDIPKPANNTPIVSDTDIQNTTTSSIKNNIETDTTKETARAKIVEDEKDFTLSDDTLKEIANNTGLTNNSLLALADALTKLVRVMQTNSNNNTTIIAGNNQQSQPKPAAAIAASNVDPISRIRRQFAIS